MEPDAILRPHVYGAAKAAPPHLPRPNPLAPCHPQVIRMHRPEDISRELAHSAGSWWELYAPAHTHAAGAGASAGAGAGAAAAAAASGDRAPPLDLLSLPLSAVRGRCSVRLPASGSAGATAAAAAVSGSSISGWQQQAPRQQHVWQVVGAYDPSTGQVGPPPASLEQAGLLPPPPPPPAPAATAGGRVRAGPLPPPPPPQQQPPLVAMDIFAGAGGLSLGLHQVCTARATWCVCVTVCVCVCMCVCVCVCL